MEKRLFAAIFLSLAVVFGFQMFFAPKPTEKPVEKLVSVDSKDITEKTTQANAVSGQGRDKNKEEAAAFIEEKTTLALAGIKVVFTNKGGDVVSIDLPDQAYAVPAKKYFNLPSFENKQFRLIKKTDYQVVYSYAGQEWQVSKTFTLDKKGLFSCQLSIKNISTGKLSFVENFNAFVVDLSRMDNSVKNSDWTLFEYSIATDKNIIRKSSVNNLTEKWNKEEEKPVKWFGFRDRYFATIAAPSFDVKKYSVRFVSSQELALGSMISNINMSAGDVLDYQMAIYAGPQKIENLKAADKGFEKILVFSDWGWLDAISKAIYWLLGMIYKVIPSWGLAIILVSLIVYGLMYPLTLKSLTSMRKMQVLQPKIKALQEKYKTSPEKLNQEIMQLYRQNNVNPLSGCLPMLLQMPIFVGLYQVLWRSIYFRGEGFLWIKDLSLPDRLFKLPFNIPFLGEYFNIFPILMIGIMVVQQKLSMKNIVATDSEQAAQQKMMATIFPILIGFIFYNFSSGLNLYFVVFYVLSAVTQWKITKDNAGS